MPCGDATRLQDFAEGVVWGLVFQKRRRRGDERPLRFRHPK